MEDFEHFLESIDLKKYREAYLPLKIVEMDMPKDVQALRLLYKIYWDERRFISFEDFYAEYTHEHKTQLTVFHHKTQLCLVCFDKGLPARIYRTWASILTQIHATYVSKSVFGIGSVSVTVELDRRGADFQVTYKGHTLNYQVKKESWSREVRKAKTPKEQLPGEFILIEYSVPEYGMVISPHKKNGEFKKAYQAFYDAWLATGKIKVLANGFVVFTKKLFEEKKQELDISVERAK